MAGFGQLLDVQDLDAKIDQLNHRIANDAQHGVVAAGEAAIVALADKIAALEVERFAVAREQKRYEDEASATEDKVKQLDASLYDGSVGGAKALEALQHEIAHVKEHQGTIEDAAIQQMELGEPLDAELEALHAQKAAAIEDLEVQRRTLTTILANAEAELEQAKIDRIARAEGISEDVLATYETKRRQGAGVGAARLAKGGTCEGCHLNLARADYDTLKHADIDEMIFCPECDRILIR